MKFDEEGPVGWIKKNGKRKKRGSGLGKGEEGGEGGEGGFDLPDRKVLAADALLLLLTTKTKRMRMVMIMKKE